MSDAATTESLFTYGTLQLPEVQLDTFGRRIDGEQDALPGFRVEWTDVTDEHVAPISGRHAHPVLRRTDDPHDRVFGRLLHVSPQELDAADEYEVSLYRRASVVLASGARAWVYVAA